jgi:hypothetical protein
LEAAEYTERSAILFKDAAYNQPSVIRAAAAAAVVVAAFELPLPFKRGGKFRRVFYLYSQANLEYLE